MKLVIVIYYIFLLYNFTPVALPKSSGSPFNLVSWNISHKQKQLFTIYYLYLLLLMLALVREKQHSIRRLGDKLIYK